MNRRSFLLNSAAGASVLLMPPSFASENVKTVDTGKPIPFSYEWLTETMRKAAQEAYREPEVELPEPIANLSYDEHRAIRFRPEHAIWRGEAPFEIQAFHMGWLFKQPVRMFVVEGNQAKPLVFAGTDFQYHKPLDPARFHNVVMPGTAGFRLHHPLNDPDVMDELVTFLGASYFRALGRGSLYGLSARGLAVNTATSQGEEFPRFTDFYIQKPGPRSDEISIYASLDSPSLTGAYAFRIVPGEVTRMQVTARLFIRKDIERLGVAPMTSMFLFGENNHASFDDYRGEVHDSDGLKIVRANGAEMWRSLNNPRQLANSFFAEENPRAFGLFQRDRRFDNYQDGAAGYERRPSLLVEPLGNWGKGWISLVEIPTDLEINDNIVAFWTPEAEVRSGQELAFSYRLIWGSIDESRNQKIGRVLSVRTGVGGVSGVPEEEKKIKGLRKFVVDFGGGPLRNLPAQANVKAHVNVRGGDIAHSTVSQLDPNGVWRFVLDLKPMGDEPVEIDAFLSSGERRLSETWFYQWRRGDGKQA